MKCCSLFILLFLPLIGQAAPLALSLHAEAVIVINADTGAVLYEKNARKLHYPASITKVATALYALKLKGNQLDDLVTGEQEAIATTSSEAKQRANYNLPPYWLENDGTHIGIKRGEQLTLRDLLYGMMVPSGNDAANVIAQFAGDGSIPLFMEGLNRYLKELGCKHTTFYNPHGLHHPQHQTTAQDMAVIAQEALKDPFFRQVVSTVRYQRPQTNKQEPSILVQSNMLLRKGKKNYYPYAIGIKTGYHSRAGHTLVAAAKKDDRTLIAVLLKEKKRPELFEDAIKIFDAAFKQNRVKRTLIKAGPQTYTLKLEGAVKPIATMLREDLTLTYYPAEEPKVKCLLFWDSLKPPIAKEQQVGEIWVKAAGERWIVSAPLLAQEEVKASWTFTLKQQYRHHPILMLGGFIAAALLIFGLLRFFRRF